MPQTREQFIGVYKDGGLFRDAEHLTVNRPLGAVVADVTDYANRCLNVRVTNPPSFRHREAGGSTTYRPKMETVAGGAKSLVVQEIYNDREQAGAPPGGLFTLVAELRPAGKGATQVDIYHASREKMADPLKQWARGEKSACPSLARGW